MPTMARIIVVLPAPFGPISPSKFTRPRTSKDTSSMAVNPAEANRDVAALSIGQDCLIQRRSLPGRDIRRSAPVTPSGENRIMRNKQAAVTRNLYSPTKG